MSAQAQDLTGKVALVTGSSRSIGAAIAKDLAEHGASVVVNYVSDAKAAESVVSDITSKTNGKAIAIQADLSNPAAGKALIEATIKEFGQLDILVLNAAIIGDRLIDKVDEKFYDAMMDTNVKTPLFMAQEGAKYLPSGGRLIFFSSTLTSASSVFSQYLCYCATKGAIEQICRCLAKELGARGITVNTVSPGPIDTPLFRGDKTEERINFIANLAPMKRIGLPDEVAPLVSFLAGSGAQWINGQNIRVNGGYVV